MYEALQTKNLYDLSHTIAAPLLAEMVYPWEALSGIHAFIARAGAALPAEEYDHPRETVWIHKTAKVAPTAFIGDEVIIGPETEVRHRLVIVEKVKDTPAIYPRSFARIKKAPLK